MATTKMKRETVPDPTEREIPPPDAMLPTVVASSASLSPVDPQLQETWFSWPVTGADARRLSAVMRIGGSRKLLDMVDSIITVNRVASCFEDVPHPETGEVSRLLKITLFGPDGRSWECHSAGVARCCKVLMGTYGPGPWEPAVSLRVCRRPTSAGKAELLVVPEV